MGCLIHLCLAYDVDLRFIPMAEPWRNGVVEKFNDHYRGGFLRRLLMQGAEELYRESLAFEVKHNTRYRYTKLQGRTPQMALALAQIRLPESPLAPKHPLPKPERGRYHVVRFIRGDAVLDVFGEKFRVPPEVVYEYVPIVPLHPRSVYCHDHTDCRQRFRVHHNLPRFCRDPYR